ncbi:hypothetical protein A3J03_05485 [Candidatus Uhrbacteria bacterium RIFCSPLOWO2_02_FULL_46_25]|nr:MAG: hypothetical protein A3J03_05485 [Candidatus Uhrbacteria bacterium RIFCSPLOWO2_02_FULL_46_25]
MHHRGFTLIELLIVIAIIGILSTLAVVSLGNARARARDAKRIADLKQIQTALNLFYDQTGKYPQSPGHATWSGHWAYFSKCLEQGTNCGFDISNYVPVMKNVPQDPLRKTADPFANDKTYFPGFPTGCLDGQNYRLAVNLETDHPALSDDLDGSFYSNNDGCEDSTRGYCVGVGTCSGW